MSKKETSKQRCEDCGKAGHSASYHLKHNISSKGYPRSDPDYDSAHEQATKKEKQKFPRKNYNELKHLDQSIPSTELLGKNSRKGSISVSTRVPVADRSEVAFHEKTESRILRKKNKKR